MAKRRSTKPERHGRPWTIRELREVERLHGEGLTLDEIAEQIGRTRSSLGHALHSYGVSLRGPWWSEDEDAKLLAMRAAGSSYAEIAEVLGRGEKACSSRWGRLRTRTPWTPEDDAELARLTSKPGAPGLKAAADALGRPLGEIRQRLAHPDVAPLVEAARAQAREARRPRCRAWTEDEIATLIRLREQGLTRAQIAAGLQCSAGSLGGLIGRLLSEGRIDPIPSAARVHMRVAPSISRRWTDEEIETARVMHGEGATYAEIAEQIGRSVGAVCGKIHYMRARGRWS